MEAEAAAQKARRDLGGDSDSARTARRQSAPGICTCTCVTCTAASSGLDTSWKAGGGEDSPQGHQHSEVSNPGLVSAEGSFVY